MKIHFHRMDKASLRERVQIKKFSELSNCGLIFILCAIIILVFSIHGICRVDAEKLTSSAFILEEVRILPIRRNQSIRLSGTDVNSGSPVEYRIPERFMPKPVQWLKVDLDKQLGRYVSVHSYESYAYSVSSGGVVYVDPEESLARSYRDDLCFILFGTCMLLGGMLCLLFAFGAIQIEIQSGKIYPE